MCAIIWSSSKNNIILCLCCLRAHCILKVCVDA
jgi:hypothetical protein